MMISNQAIEVILMTIIVVFRIQNIICAPGNNVIEGESSDELKIDLNEALELFSREYKSRHQVTAIVPDSIKLEKATQWVEFGTDATFFGTVKLNFSFSNDDGQTKQSSVFLKIPELGTQNDLAKTFHCYEKEEFMYRTILPLMQEGLEWRKTFSPHFYGSTDSGIMVLENIRESGFYPIDDNLQKDFTADWAMCLRVFYSLARFHAFSFARVNEKHHMETLNHFNEERVYFFKFDDEKHRLVLDKFRKHLIPKLSEDVKLEVIRAIDEFTETQSLAQLVDGNVFNVILIGDPNRMNVFCQNGDSKKTFVECKFVDFMMCRRGSPVMDLASYFMTSVDIAVVEKYSDELLHSYLSELQKTMEILRFSNGYRYDMEDLLADLKKHKLYFIRLLIFHAIDVPSFEKQREDRDADKKIENNFDNLFTSQDFISFFERWVKLFLKW